MRQNSGEPGRFKEHLRAVIEVAFIVFLFYSNLLMGEFTHGKEVGNTLWHALADIFTTADLAIAIVTAVIAHGVFSMFRRKLS
jgi:hypothetical protein